MTFTFKESWVKREDTSVYAYFAVQLLTHRIQRRLLKATTVVSLKIQESRFCVVNFHNEILV